MATQCIWAFKHGQDDQLNLKPSSRMGKTGSLSEFGTWWAGPSFPHCHLWGLQKNRSYLNDESQFLLSQLNGGVRNWCQQHERLDASFLVSEVQAGGDGVMMRGTFSWHSSDLLLEHCLDMSKKHHKSQITLSWGFFLGGGGLNALNAFSFSPFWCVLSKFWINFSLITVHFLLST